MISFANYFDDRSRNYRPLARYSTSILKEIRQDLRRSLSLGVPHALDVGAGTGFPSSYVLAAFPNRELTLLDTSADMLREAEGRFGRGVKTVVGDACSLPFEAGAFSLVTTFCAMHCFSNKEAFLRESHRVLAPSGTLLIAFNDRLKLQKQIVHECFPDFYVRDAPRQCEAVELQQMLASSGYQLRSHSSRPWVQRFATVESYLKFISSRPFSGFSLFSDAEFERSLAAFRQVVLDRYDRNQRVRNHGSLDWIIAERLP